MNPLIHVISNDVSCAEDMSFLSSTVTNGLPTENRWPPRVTIPGNPFDPRATEYSESSIPSSGFPMVAGMRAVTGSPRPTDSSTSNSVPPADSTDARFTTVVFVREDCAPGETFHHVATMRVPLSSPDMTVRQLAKEAMHRLAAVLRRQEKEKALRNRNEASPQASPEKSGTPQCGLHTFVGVSQVLVEGKASAMRLYAMSNNEAQVEGKAPLVVLPPSEVFSADLVRQVMNLGEELVVMRLRPSEAARRLAPLPDPPRAATVLEPATVPKKPSSIDKKRHRAYETSPSEENMDDASFSSSYSDDDGAHEEHKQPLRHTAALDDTDVEMVAKELRARGRNRLGWGPDAYKNFDANYVPSPQKLMAKPRRIHRRRKTEEVPSDAPHEGTNSAVVAVDPLTKTATLAKVNRTLETDTAESADAVTETLAAHANDAGAVAAVLSVTNKNVQEQPQEPRDDEQRAQTVIENLGGDRSLPPIAIPPGCSKKDSAAPTTPLREREKGRSPQTPHQPSTPCLATAKALHPQTPPGQITARRLQWEESSSASRTASKPVAAEDAPHGTSSPGLSPTSPQLLGVSSSESTGNETPASQALPQTPSSGSKARTIAKQMTPAAISSPTKTPLTTPEKRFTLDISRAPTTPLPKGWGGEAAKFFDPETYCDDPAHARVTHRSPIRARRHVEIPDYFSILDSALSDRAILKKLSQIRGNSQSPTQ